MQNKYFLIIAFIAILSQGYSQSDTIVLTFEQALSKMNNDNLTLKSVEAEKKANEFRRKTTRGLYLPRFTFSASYMKFDQDIGLNIDGYSQHLKDLGLVNQNSMLPSTLVIQKEQFAAANINMIWPIFTGGKIMALNKAMDASIDDAQYKIEQTKNELNTELVQRYYGYRLSLRAVDLYTEVYESMLLHQDAAKKLEENGMISKAQTLYTNIAVSQAKTELQSAVNKSNTVKDALKNTLADSSEIRAISELFLIKKIESVEYFQQSAMQNSPLLKQVEAKKSMAEQSYSIEKSNYLPTISIVGNKELAQYQLSEIMPEWFVGVNLSWTIFDGTSRIHKTQTAKATVQRVDFIQQKAQSDISTYINKLYNELMSYVEQLETMQTTYEFAVEYQRVQYKAFREGFATSSDVVDAETTLAKVKVGRLKIMNDYVLTLAKLLEFSGQSNLFLQYSKREDREREEFKETKK